ncbi:MAG: VRR-NUC domain-containing protein [Bacteroidetes bacterium]|nr:VRR-NUC domain-containing protein [Bacteroidota bacterium]
MNEKLIEQKLREAIKQIGGLALKFTSPSFTGVPDRIVLLPGGKLWFVETKSTGEKISPRQQVVFPMLQKLGFKVEVIDSQTGLDCFIEKCKNHGT